MENYLPQGLCHILGCCMEDLLCFVVMEPRDPGQKGSFFFHSEDKRFYGKNSLPKDCCIRGMLFLPGDLFGSSMGGRNIVFVPLDAVN